MLIMLISTAEGACEMTAFITKNINLLLTHSLTYYCTILELDTTLSNFTAALSHLHAFIKR